MKRRHWLQAACAGTLAASIAPAHSLMAGAPPDTAAARIDANTASSPWSGVVSVVVNGSAYSGVAIGRQRVLTAAHVAAGGTPATIQVAVNLSGTPAMQAVGAVSIYPGYTFPYDDLAVLHLTSPLPTGTATYPIVDTQLPSITTVTLAGYGQSGNGAVGPSGGALSSVKRTGRNVVDMLTDRMDSSGRTGAFFIYDFDGPSGTGPTGGPTLGNAVETCVASGDSGSGAFVETGAGPALYALSTMMLNLGAGTSAKFGNGGGGIVLSHPPYLAWLRTQGDSSLAMLSQVQSADVPVAPGWALAALGAAFAAHTLRRRSTGHG